MPLEVSRFSFYLVTLNCWCSSDLISMHEVMPLTLAPPAPGHRSSLPSPRFHHAGVGRSALLLRLEHLPAILCCALLRRTHTRAVSWLRSHGPAWSAVCQPQLVGSSQLGLARSLWHMVSWSGREAATPCYRCVRCQ